MTTSDGKQPARRRRTREQPIADLLRKIGAEEDAPRADHHQSACDLGAVAEPGEMTRRERMARVLWNVALDGNLKAMQLILNYTDSRPVQPVAVRVAARFTADEYAQAMERLAEWRAERDASQTAEDTGA